MNLIKLCLMLNTAHGIYQTLSSVPVVFTERIYALVYLASFSSRVFSLASFMLGYDTLAYTLIVPSAVGGFIDFMQIPSNTLSYKKYQLLILAICLQNLLTN